MLECKFCSKSFPSKSKLEAHTKRKTLCNKPKESYNCELCKANFNHKSHLDIHEKSKKHITNYSNYNIHIDDKEIKFSSNELKLKEENELLKQEIIDLKTIENQNINTFEEPVLTPLFI